MTGRTGYIALPYKPKKLAKYLSRIIKRDYDEAIDDLNKWFKGGYDWCFLDLEQIPGVLKERKNFFLVPVLDDSILTPVVSVDVDMYKLKPKQLVRLRTGEFTVVKSITLQENLFLVKLANCTNELPYRSNGLCSSHIAFSITIIF